MGKKLKILVAHGYKREVFDDAQMRWKLKGEFEWIERVASGSAQTQKKSALVMDWETWNSVPVEMRPLNGALNIIVISSDVTPPHDAGFTVAGCLPSAFELVSSRADIGDVFVLGGLAFHKATIGRASEIFATEVVARFPRGDRFPIIPRHFKRCVCETVESNGLTIQRVAYRPALKGGKSTRRRRSAP